MISMQVARLSMMFVEFGIRNDVGYDPLAVVVSLTPLSVSMYSYDRERRMILLIIKTKIKRIL